MELKKLLLLGLASTLFLAACDNEESDTETAVESEEVTEDTTDDEEVVEDDAEDEESDEGEPEEETSEASDTYFEGDNGTYDITNVQQVTGEYGTELVVIDMTYTNNSDDAQSAWFAFAFDMSATQIVGPTQETLIGGNGQIPEEYQTEFGMDDDIVPGETVDTQIAYEIEAPGEPVIIQDSNMMGDNGENFYLEIETTEVE